MRRGSLIAVALLSACSPSRMAMNRMSSVLASSTAIYEADNDPEFVRLAAPSTLKTVEMLLAQSPDNPKLLLTACSGFTEYSYAFLQVESELHAPDPTMAQDLKLRAGRMYERARGYCLRGLSERLRGLTQAALVKDAPAVLTPAARVDVPWLYWLAASWGADLTLSPNPLAHLPEFVAVRAILNRARDLDPGWGQGAIYEALIPFDGMPPLLGGSMDRTRTDFQKALELSNGTSAFAYVAMARVTSDQAERTTLLREAVAIDVSTMTSRRLTNLIAQRYAKALLTTGPPAPPAVR